MIIIIKLTIEEMLSIIVCSRYAAMNEKKVSPIVSPETMKYRLWNSKGMLSTMTDDALVPAKLI